MKQKNKRKRQAKIAKEKKELVVPQQILQSQDTEAVAYIKGKCKCELSPFSEYIRDKIIGSGFEVSISELRKELVEMGETNLSRQDLHYYKRKLMKISGNPEIYKIKFPRKDLERLAYADGCERLPSEAIEEVRSKTYKTLSELKNNKDLPDDVKQLIKSVERRLESVFIVSAEMYEKLDIIDTRVWIIRSMQLRIASRMELESTLGIAFKDTGEDLERMSRVLSDLKKDKQDLGLFPRGAVELPEGSMFNISQTNINFGTINKERQEEINAYIKVYTESCKSVGELLDKQKQ